MSRNAPTARARSLRATQTHAEARLWHVLRARRLGGWKWRRQVPVGPYIADFLCLEAALVVELDGGQHSETLAYDARRTAYLQAQGFRVIRFWNSYVLEFRSAACDVILAACGGETPSPNLSPRGGEEEPGPTSSNLLSPSCGLPDSHIGVGG
ncbi:endonuclease domain-containing protein [Phenylobacterium sp.]|uniref:endonuclease domain-containing protein n=1 Tax=Phenylobacterium sp. TaxID=1871053 RepID=UPI00271FE9B5|nr:endonuclease domain-containing protein [Phenylobacterium sp.]MDO8377695.1 endonuclease domain-containing protein [Phenylobacterium sp.]